MERLRVVMIVEDFSRISGGVPAVVYQLSERMAADGFDVHIISSHYDPMSPPPGVTLHYCPPKGLGKKWYWSEKFGEKLLTFARESTQLRTVFHIHGVWQGPQYFAGKVAKKYKIPYIVSAHGMLEPWLWHKQGRLVYLKKKIYWSFWGKRTYTGAAALHAITPLESRNLSELLGKKNIKVIENAISIEDDCSNLSFPEYTKTVLFLGRIDPKKGVDILISAFGKSFNQGWKLVIAGPTWSSDYVKRLQQLAAECIPDSQVVFTGPIFGVDKDKLIKHSWVMVVPSYSEVVGLVNLEAAKHMLPTITTFETGLEDWEQGGGVLVNAEPHSIKLALNQCYHWSEEERRERGQSSHNLVAKKYSWGNAIIKWKNFYRELSQENS